MGSSPSTVTSSVPGKLMVAGEYSVLTPGGHAIAFAVHPGLMVTLRPGEEDTLTSHALGVENVSLQPEGLTSFAYYALAYCRRAFPLPNSWNITVEGGLRVDGEKVGLGGSASVVSGVVQCWRQLVASDCGVEWSRIAMDAHYEASGNRGSGYDVATTTHGGVVLYAPKSANKDAPMIRTLPWPKGLVWMAGFCGKGVSTRALLDRTRPSERSPLVSMRQGVDRLISAWEGGEVRSVLSNLAELDPLFEAWSQEEGLLLMTESMAKMRALAHEEGGVCRVSGAGGGDSLLVFSDDAAVLKRIEGRWEANGFPTLQLTLEP